MKSYANFYRFFVMKILRVLPLCFFYVFGCSNSDATSQGSPELFASQAMDIGDESSPSGIPGIDRAPFTQAPADVYDPSSSGIVEDSMPQSPLTHHTLIVNFESDGITLHSTIRFPVDPPTEILDTTPLQQLTRVHPTLLAFAGIKASLELELYPSGTLTLSCDGPLRGNFYTALEEIIAMKRLSSLSITMVPEDLNHICLAPLYTVLGDNNYTYTITPNPFGAIITARLQ